MTTTTRTTRKAPWAAVLTALLAVLALLFGAMTMAAPATAKNDPDKTPPGQSEEFVPPGQDETFVPPGQDENVVPPGQGDRPNTEKKIWICHADVNHNGDAGLGDGKGGEFQLGYNLIFIARQAAQNAHFDLHPMDVAADMSTGSPVCPAPVTKYFCPTGSTYPATELDGLYDAVTDQATCYKPTVVQTCPDGTPLPANGICPTSVTPTYACPDTTAKATRPMTHLYNPTVPEDVAFCGITAEEAAGIDAAMAATVPEAVAPVLPATVPVEAPETVAVPAPATVATPAAVPAGDGSTVPQVPVALLALLALATAAAVTSGLRMATNR